MSEHLSEGRRQEIHDEVYEEFDMTRLKMELYLREHGVGFLQTDIPLGETEPPCAPSFMDHVRQTVSEQHEKLGRDLSEDEMMLVMEFHSRRVRNDTYRIQREAENSLAMVRITLEMIGYWTALQSGRVAEAERRKHTLYAYVEKSGLPEVWRYMLDEEFGYL